MLLSCPLILSSSRYLISAILAVRSFVNKQYLAIFRARHHRSVLLLFTHLIHWMEPLFLNVSFGDRIGRGWGGGGAAIHRISHLPNQLEIIHLVIIVHEGISYGCHASQSPTSAPFLYLSLIVNPCPSPRYRVLLYDGRLWVILSIGSLCPNPGMYLSSESESDGAL